MVRAVFFDFYGTLVHFGDYHLHATREFLDALDLDDEPAEFFEHWNEHFYAMKDDLVESDEFLPIWHLYGESLDRAFQERGHDLTSGEIGEAVQICMERLPKFLEKAPGVDATLDALDGMRLAVVSNADEDDLQRQLAAIGVRDRFEVIVSSEQAQAYKPHPRIFELALERLDLPAEEIAFVGDSLEWDIKGANALGMQTVWYNARDQDRVDGIDPDHEIDDLTDLADIVR